MSPTLGSLADWHAFEDQWLAPYAMRSGASRGRRHAEPLHPFRSAFQRDRERIVHSSAFRRMTGKTQVLVASVNDHHRTRLTHTLEVTQVARTVARRLRLNEDLTETIALAHDIGHPPFGHAGEDALNECLKQHGGFNHNLYGLRRVDELEERYPEFPGLNLTFEVRESFLQHCRKLDGPEAAEFRDSGSPLLEAQVVDVVDSIAYDTHDIDDALGLGFVAFDDLRDVELWQATVQKVRTNYPDLSGNPLRTAVVRELLAWQVNDLLEESARRLNQENIHSVQGVRSARTPLVGLSLRMELLKRGLEQFLRDRVYRHHRVLRMTANGKRILRMLFEEYVKSPELLPERQLSRWTGAGRNASSPTLPGRTMVDSLERVVADYLAGMTDRFAQQEYRRLFQPTIDL
ncbi:deoxyguanosinetriphosphate triphosphohydrolase [Limnoglobus roseus]|uniref:Deoxyguanosinetriphosphate triphosphohydrolase-like protein n=1 Tax=Limnoglobus roseus TaxID=2598579 RepID=A0A5C1ANI5_9BACT|nr:deoxyguanosinetriphosphate triphosphohydrolase [Limnoglobus roseus]QEL19707.1 deoxyguanosinetriphosphate triphosphohydrolase [Limnoglobus roseus]